MRGKREWERSWVERGGEEVRLERHQREGIWSLEWVRRTV
jgi:hypothetical protein